MMKYDRGTLRQMVRSGAQLDYLLFWGHTPRKDGRISTQCLSQWFASPFKVDGVRYATAEHWMMAEKARLFADEASVERILSTGDPGTAKGLGRKVANFDDTVWKTQCYDIVLKGSVYKFSAYEAMTSFLLGTGEKMLVEASPMDTIWGIGVGRDDPRATQPQEWLGDNLLGFALMEARDILKERQG